MDIEYIILITESSQCILDKLTHLLSILYLDYSVVVVLAIRSIELGSKDIINKVGTEEEISLAVRRTH